MSKIAKNIFKDVERSSVFRKLNYIQSSKIIDTKIIYIAGSTYYHKIDIENIAYKFNAKLLLVPQLQLWNAYQTPNNKTG